MKKQILLSCALAWAVMAGAETIDITTFRYAGPYVVQAPFQVDSVDVNYYGGCSPVSRNFESRYPHHAYAALGYVVYVIEPSGATGFGYPPSNISFLIR
jgi:hypothetical protein